MSTMPVAQHDRESMSTPQTETRHTTAAHGAGNHPVRWGMIALAIAMTLATVLARFATHSLFGDRPALIFIILPILLSAYFGGLIAGLASTAVAAVATNYFVMRPFYRFGFESAVDAVQWLFLIVVGVLISVLTESLRQQRDFSHQASGPDAPQSTERIVQVGFGLALTFLLVIGVVSMLGVRRLRVDTRWTTHTEAVIASLRQLLSALNDAENAQRGYVLTGDASHLQPFDDAGRMVDTELQRLRALTADNSDQQRRLATLAPLAVQRVAVARENLDLRRTEGFEAARTGVQAGTGQQLHDRVRLAISEMEATEHDLLEQREGEVRRIGSITLAVIVVGGALAFVFVSVALLVMQREFAFRRQTEAALREARDQLELRVRERTADLEQANVALRGSGARYREALESMMEGCSLVGRDWRYLYVNDTGARHARQSKEQLIGRTVQECHPGIEAGLLFADLRRCMEDRVPRRVQQEMTWPDGTATLFELAIQPAPEGILVLSLDVTERHRAQAVLRESQERLEAVTENLTEGLIVLSLDGELVHWNRAAILMHGFASRDECLRDASDLASTFEVATLDGDVLGSDERPLTRVLRGERLRACTVRIRRTGTDWARVFSYSGSIVNDASGKPLAFLAVIDITESQRVAAQAREQLDELLRWQQVTLDREDRVQGLKAEVNALLDGQGQPQRYARLAAS